CVADAAPASTPGGAARITEGRGGEEGARSMSVPPGVAGGTPALRKEASEPGKGAAGADAGAAAYVSRPPRARNSRSEVIGSSVTRAPTASRTALAMAAGPGTTGGSPTPLAPN